MIAHTTYAITQKYAQFKSCCPNRSGSITSTLYPHDLNFRDIESNTSEKIQTDGAVLQCCVSILLGLRAGSVGYLGVRLSVD